MVLKVTLVSMVTFISSTMFPIAKCCIIYQNLIFGLNMQIHFAYNYVYTL